MDHEYTDRYDALGIPYPDPETMCKGQCDGVGAYPTKLEDATPEEGKRWLAAHESGEGHENGECNGWHFITCPDCNGTGKAVSKNF